MSLSKSIIHLKTHVFEATLNNRFTKHSVGNWSWKVNKNVFLMRVKRERERIAQSVSLFLCYPLLLLPFLVFRYNSMQRWKIQHAKSVDTSKRPILFELQTRFNSLNKSWIYYQFCVLIVKQHKVIRRTCNLNV